MECCTAELVIWLEEMQRRLKLRVNAKHVECCHPLPRDRWQHVG